MRFVNLIAISLGALLFSACGLGPDPTPDFRYRLKVEVETPQGFKTGSSVIEVETSMGRSSMAPAGSVIMQKLRGEAVAVDLGNGRTLFALLRSRTEVDWAKQVMLSMTPYVRPSDGDGFEATFQKMLQRKSEIVLPAYYPNSRDGNVPARPMLVTFTDLSDPTSVADVDPDNLAVTFGEGVMLKRITVQMTDDPVTTGIEERLGWLSNQRGSLIPIPRGTPIGEMPIGSDITEGDFSRSAAQ